MRFLVIFALALFCLSLNAQEVNIEGVSFLVKEKDIFSEEKNITSVLGDKKKN